MLIIVKKKLIIKKLYKGLLASTFHINVLQPRGLYCLIIIQQVSCQILLLKELVFNFEFLVSNFLESATELQYV